MWGKTESIKSENVNGRVTNGYIGVMERNAGGKKTIVYLTEAGNGSDSERGFYHVEENLHGCSNRGAFSMFDSPKQVLYAFQLFRGNLKSMYKLVGIMKMSHWEVSTFENINLKLTLG